MIPDRNPIKRVPSPTFSSRLPFQRRAKSSSPEKEALVISTTSRSFFPPNQPVSPSRPTLDGFSGVIFERTDQVVEEDEDLKLIKQMYLNMLSQAEESDQPAEIASPRLQN